MYSNSKHISHCGVITNCVSDHFPTYIVRKKAKAVHRLTTFSCRKLKHFDVDFYSNRLLEIDWRLFYNSTNPNEAWSLLYKNVLLVLDKYYPMVNFRNVRVKSEWICQEIYEQMLRRDEAYSQARITHLQSDWNNAHRLRNLINYLCKTAKNEYIKKKLSDNRLNPRKIWADLKILWGNSKEKESEPIRLFSDTSGHAVHVQKTADHFNGYFSSIAEQLQSSIPPPE